MPEEHQKPTLDLGKITFPTDAVTLGQIRQRQPELLTNSGLASSKYLSEIDILCLADAEIAMSEKAFAAALKMPDPRPKDDPRDLVELLNTEYVEWGLSSGLQRTRQMVRNFQAAAAKQAKDFRGQSL